MDLRYSLLFLIAVLLVPIVIWNINKPIALTFNVTDKFDDDGCYRIQCFGNVEIKSVCKFNGSNCEQFNYSFENGKLCGGSSGSEFSLKYVCDYEKLKTLAALGIFVFILGLIALAIMKL